MVRTTSCEKTGLMRGAWTPEEDRRLSSYIKKYGHWNWRELPMYAGMNLTHNLIAKLVSNSSSNDRTIDQVLCYLC